MRKSLKLFAGVALTVFAGVSHAHMQAGIPVYNTYYYSDASKQTQVGGVYFNYCTYYNETDGAQYSLSGIQTAYSDDSLVGYCSEWTYYPI